MIVSEDTSVCVLRLLSRLGGGTVYTGINGAAYKILLAGFG